MAPELPQELIQHLVAIGETEHFSDGDQLPARFPLSRSGAFMRLGPHPWYDVASSLPDGQLVALIKALTVLEGRAPHFRAGSVSPVIWLFRKLSERSPEDHTAVVEWILSHTENDYLPFGSYNFGAKSLAELHASSARSADSARSRHFAEEIRRLDAKSRKATDATRKLFNALRRRDEKAVASLLLKGADIHAANEHGQTAIEYARTIGLGDLLTSGHDSAVESDAPRASPSA